MNDDEPELRQGPPWVMEEMIDAEPALADQISRRGAAGLLAARIADTAQAAEPIVVCGCGTSEHAARAIEAILARTLPGTEMKARDAFEVQLDPPDRGLLIAVSHEGTTAATLAAARHAAARGARALLITARPAKAPAGVEAIGTPLLDRSWCHTVAYLSPILTCALGAGLDAQAARRLVDHEFAARIHRRNEAAELGGCHRLLIIGSGVDEITAAELALKIEEAAHIPCTSLGVEKVLHGHLPAADARTGAVLLRFDPAHATIRDARTASVAAAVEVLSMPTVQLATPGLRSRAEALIAGAVALQLLTLELAIVHGTNPDLIRREQPLYRKVAQVAGAG
jgi:fructoselysine-6-P-deglycase FrlB-like protein